MDKKPFGYRLGQIMAAAILLSLTILVVASVSAITIKLLTLIFSFLH